METGLSDPLTATEALAVLEATDALERIKDFGYEAADVYRAVELPSPCMLYYVSKTKHSVPLRL